MLLILFNEQGALPQPGHANLSLAVSDLWAALNASGPGDAVYWSTDELFAWMEEASRYLARTYGLFISRDESLASATGTPSYDLPAANIATIQLDLAGKTLRPRTVLEIESLDSAWEATQGAPKAFLLDTEGLKKLRLYPVPVLDSETIGIVQRTQPDAITPATAVIPVPPVMREYFTIKALAGAMAKETPGSKDELVQWLNGVAQLYEQAASELWGS